MAEGACEGQPFLLVQKRAAVSLNASGAKLTRACVPRTVNFVTISKYYKFFSFENMKQHSMQSFMVPIG